MSEKLRPPGTPSRRDVGPEAPFAEDPALATDPPPEPLGWEESREVVNTAWELQAEAEARADAERRTREMAEAAAEVGLDEAHLPLAEGLVRARVEERARRRVEARRRWMVAAGLLGALALGAWVVRPSPPAPFAPWSDDLGGWTLETSAGTLATVARAEEPGRGTVTAVSVERFVPLADGRYWANLESTGHDWTGARTVTFAVRGAAPTAEGEGPAAKGKGLETVRLYLETPDERWRGPPVPLGSAWQTHTLAIADFEHQVRSGGEWRVVADAPPRGVETASFKLGWWVNDAGASGTVLLDDLRVE